jgi:outer membrane receptor protein involved in Fe transport
MLDRRLRLNAAVFYADYEDMQLDIVVPDQPNPALTQTENAGQANITGFELDLEALLTPGLRASLSYGYLDTEIEKVEGDDHRFWVLQNAPDNQVSAAVDWDVWSWGAATLNIAFDYTHRDSVFTSARRRLAGGHHQRGLLLRPVGAHSRRLAHRRACVHTNRADWSATAGLRDT